MPDINEPIRDEAPSSESPAEEPKVLSLQEIPTEDGSSDEVVAHGSTVSLAACARPGGE